MLIETVQFARSTATMCKVPLVLDWIRGFSFPHLHRSRPTTNLNGYELARIRSGNGTGHGLSSWPWKSINRRHWDGVVKGNAIASLEHHIRSVVFLGSVCFRRGIANFVRAICGGSICSCVHGVLFGVFWKSYKFCWFIYFVVFGVWTLVCLCFGSRLLCFLLHFLFSLCLSFFFLCIRSWFEQWRPARVSPMQWRAVLLRLPLEERSQSWLQGWMWNRLL